MVSKLLPRRLKLLIKNWIKNIFHFKNQTDFENDFIQHRENYERSLPKPDLE